jgi:hypothetical protein
MKSRKALWTTTLLLTAVAGYAGWIGYLAWRDLVTLDVRNMDVREVVKKMERQTWESISVDKGVEGKVTLKVTRAPLQKVLQLVAEQTFARPTVIYPLYKSEQSLTTLKQALNGQLDAAEHGWTNLQSRGFGMMGGGGPMMMMGGPGGFAGMNQNPAPKNVTLNFAGKDLSFAVLAFQRFAQTRVVPEDGAEATITLTLKEAPVKSAVAQLAKRADRNWTILYALQAGFGGPRGPGGGPQFVSRGDGPGMGQSDGPRMGFGRPEMSDEKREEMRQQRETLEQELRQVLPAEERQKLEAEQQEREKQMQEMANMTDEQRRERMGQMFSGGRADQMNRQRLLNSTPEQRAQMDQRMGQRGPGGPGGGGRGPR